MRGSLGEQGFKEGSVIVVCEIEVCAAYQTYMVGNQVILPASKIIHVFLFTAQLSDICIVIRLHSLSQ